MKRILLIFCLFIGLTSVSAQTKQNPWSIGIHAGSEQYNGEIENQFFNFFDHHNGFAGLSASRYLSPHLDVGLDLTLGDIKFTSTGESNRRYRFNMNQANLHLQYNFFNYNDVKLRPFVFAGIGMIAFDGEGENQSNLTLPAAGLGVNYKLNEQVSIRYQNTLLVSDGDEIDNRTDESGNDMFLQTSIGLAAVIKSTSDLDRDGVADKNDECPETELGMKVDKKGCAIDLDLDGIPNERDKCPSDPGFEYTNGCPDSDNDSIPNADDPCPNIAGSVNGCPDSDGDGVADIDDKCPNEAGLENLSGCPEEAIVEEGKRMGVFEYNELPLENQALVVLDENGNPVDTIYTDDEGRFEFTALEADQNYSLRPINLDGDPSAVEIYLTDDSGNRRDAEETEDGKFVFTAPKDQVADKKQPKEEVKKEPKSEKKEVPSDGTIPADLLADINFDSESFNIKIKYYDQLNRLAAALNKQSDINITLFAYADSTGPADYNQRLTDNRADRVKRYLVKKGVSASRIDAMGKGEESPIATNLTQEGRAQNRRVEIRLKD
ncbi:MAG: OmpA family protein [Vicingaceae bacterium]